MRKIWNTLKARLGSGLLLEVLPLILLATLTPMIIQGIVVELSHRQLGNEAVDISKEALIAKAAEGLEARTIEVANSIACFLKEREEDVLNVALLPRDPEAYLAFVRTHSRGVWMSEGKISIPLYRELAYVNKSGLETIKVVVECEQYPAGCQAALADRLVAASDPAQTTYKQETYFADTMELLEGEIYVGRPVGWYIPTEEAYAAAENPTGRRYQGFLRFATPVFEDGVRQGIVVLTLDWTHVMEFTDHIVPTAERFAALPDATSGNYAYTVDPEGWVISHPRDYYIWGLRSDGRLVPALNEADHQAQQERGETPLNLADLGFMDSNLPLINGQAQMGRDGSVVYQWAGLEKFVAYAPIPYHRGRYSGPGGFGWVGLGANVTTFYQDAIQMGERIDYSRKRLLNVVGAITFLAILLVTGGSYLIVLRISRPVTRMAATAQQIAEGDLTRKLKVDRRGELGQLEQALNRMTENLYAAIQRIREGALQVSTSAEEMATTMHQQSAASAQQSAAVSQTTTAMEQLAATSHQIAEAADQVVSTAAKTQSEAQDGVSAVTRTVQQMEAIRDGNEISRQEIAALGQRSQRIGNVMELITHIADQTRMIAFNASIEAAAAGEAGRRFGVVATEVRQLADSVTKSTGEIRERITETQTATNALIVASEWRAKQIEEGFELTQMTARALEEILERAKEATQAAAQIRLSTQQQRTAAEQVVGALQEVQEGVKQVAMGNQQMTEVGRGLLELADKLKAAMEQFQLENE